MDGLFDVAAVFSALPRLLSRIPVTLFLVIAASLFGAAIGLVLAFIRLHKMPVLDPLARLYISFMRGTPVIVQLFLVYYGLPVIVAACSLDINRWDRLFFVLVTYSLHVAALHAEIFRASLAAIPRGQVLAASSVGMSRRQAFFRIVAPQAARLALPNIGLAITGMLQDTSLAFSVGIVDVMGEARAVGGNSQRMLEAMAGAAMIFLLLTILLDWWLGTLGRRGMPGGKSARRGLGHR
jgi:L-cystine transport system permease protein